MCQCQTKPPASGGPARRTPRLPDRAPRLEVRVRSEAAWMGVPVWATAPQPVALAFVSPSGSPRLMGRAHLRLLPTPAQGLLGAEMGTASSGPSECPGGVRKTALGSKNQPHQVDQKTTRTSILKTCHRNCSSWSARPYLPHWTGRQAEDMLDCSSLPSRPPSIIQEPRPQSSQREPRR